MRAGDDLANDAIEAEFAPRRASINPTSYGPAHLS